MNVTGPCSLIQAISTAPLRVHYYCNSEALPAEHKYCVGVSRQTASEGLAQGPYVAARAGFEPTTLRTKGDAFTNEPPSPAMLLCAMLLCCFKQSARDTL